MSSPASRGIGSQDPRGTHRSQRGAVYLSRAKQRNHPFVRCLFLLGRKQGIPNLNMEYHHGSYDFSTVCPIPFGLQSLEVQAIFSSPSVLRHSFNPQLQGVAFLCYRVIGVVYAAFNEFQKHET